MWEYNMCKQFRDTETEIFHFSVSICYDTYKSRCKRITICIRYIENIIWLNFLSKSSSNILLYMQYIYRILAKLKPPISMKVSLASLNSNLKQKWRIKLYQNNYLHCILIFKFINPLIYTFISALPYL